MTAVDAKEDLVTVTIDGIEVSVPKGTLLIRWPSRWASRSRASATHPLLDPAGACRQCLVEVTDMGNGRGMPKPAASCTTTVMPGMVIKTQLTSVVADKAQQGVMELLLINHPLDCPICDKGGECPLQNQAMSNGRAESRFLEAKRTFPKPIAISSNVLLDRERCVLCQRCTRFSLQIAGDPFIELLERGANQQIGTSEEQPFQSYFSRQYRADLPGRRTDRCVVPLPGPPVRPHVDQLGLRALLVRLRPAHRLAPLQGHPPPGRQRPRGQRGVELRQGPLGVQVRRAGRPAAHPRWCATPRVSSRPPAGPRRSSARPPAWPRPSTAAVSACCPVAGSPKRTPTPTPSSPAWRSARTTSTPAPRPVSDEELAFLATDVAGVTPAHVSYADLENAPAVLLAGLEPEEESPDRLPAPAQGVRGSASRGSGHWRRARRAGCPSSAAS